MRTILLLIALILGAALPSTALMASQAARYSWLLQHVGSVRDASFGTHLYVLSEQGVLAALHPEDGKLEWRKILAPGARLVPAGPVILGIEESRVMAFAASTGAMLWELPATNASAAAASSGRIVIAAQDTLTVLSATSGIVVASSRVEVPGEAGADLRPSVHSAGAGDSMVTVVFWAPNTRALSVVRLDSLSGEMTPVGLHAASEDLDPSAVSVLGGARLVAATVDATALCHAELQGETPLACPVQRGADARRLSGFALLSAARCGSEPALPVQTPDGLALFSFQRGALGAIAFVPGGVGTACHVDPAGKPVVAVLVPGPAPGAARLDVLHAADGGVLSSRALTGVDPDVRRLFSGAAGAALTVAQDGTLALHSSGAGAAAWRREESLASSVDALFAPLPPPTPEHEAAWKAAQPGTLRALRAHALGLKAQAGLASAEEKAEVEAYAHAVDDRLWPTRDPDGFRKQALILSAGGKVAALHSSDGHVLWTLRLPVTPGRAFKRVAAWREPHRLSAALEVAVFALDTGGEGRVFVLDAYAGKLLDTLPLPAGVESWVALPQPLASPDAAQHVYVGLSAVLHGAHVVPDTPSTRAAVEAAAPGLSLWRLAPGGAGTLEGLGLGPGASLVPRWTASLAGAGQTVLAVAQATPTAPGPFTKAFGGVDVKYKYLSPSLVLVATGPAAGDAAGDAADPVLNVHLLDAVTGRVLWSQVHEGAAGPVHAVVVGNAAVYHFWSTRAARWQVGSVELYDASPRPVSVAQLALVGPGNSSLSMWDSTPLETYSASFFTKLPAATLGVTRTVHGTTAPQILLATPSGSVYMIDRRLLDPRRPLVDKPTPAMTAEGLMPYASELPLMGSGFATHAARVARLSALHSDPATLESSTLLLARGLDLYGARLAPSRTFDQVPDDFPFALLVLVVLGMGTGAALLRRMAARKTANRAWE